MDYYKLKFKNLKDRFIPEILIAQLAEIGFESFEEETDELNAYIQSPDFNLNTLLSIENFRKLDESNDLSSEFIKAKNWNAVWESNYEAVTIDGCHIRAPFHKPNTNAEFNILLNPKMAFGTAHHETTAMMIEFVLGMHCRGLRILDMGSGTAVLAILASMKNADEIIAIDNDKWAFENAVENCELNGIQNVEPVLGDASNLHEYGEFDVILANINKNILLRDIKHYSQSLKTKGEIYFSGFYEKDLDDIKQECLANNLVFVDFFIKNKWVAAKFIKK